MNLANSAVPRTMARGNARSLQPLSKIQRYGLAVLSVSVALGGALLLDRLHFRGLVSPFLLALAVAAWYGGTGPAVLALLVSCISFAYLTEAEQLSHTGSFGWDVSS